MKPIEFAKALMETNKFYDENSKKIVFIFSGPNMLGDCVGITDDGLTIRVNAQNLFGVNKMVKEETAEEKSEAYDFAHLDAIMRDLVGYYTDDDKSSTMDAKGIFERLDMEMSSLVGNLDDKNGKDEDEISTQELFDHVEEMMHSLIGGQSEEEAIISKLSPKDKFKRLDAIMAELVGYYDDEERTPEELTSQEIFAKLDSEMREIIGLEEETAEEKSEAYDFAHLDAIMRDLVGYYTDDDKSSTMDAKGIFERLDMEMSSLVGNLDDKNGKDEDEISTQELFDHVEEMMHSLIGGQSEEEAIISKLSPKDKFKRLDAIMAELIGYYDDEERTPEELTSQEIFAKLDSEMRELVGYDKKESTESKQATVQYDFSRIDNIISELTALKEALANSSLNNYNGSGLGLK